MTEKILPLFEEYPGLKANLPHIKLVQKTNVQHLKSLGEELNIPQLYIKRDDQTSEIYGGNKPRKLEFLLADAILKKQKSEVLTIGGTGSNHCLATTIFAKQLNLHPVLLLFHQPVTADVQEKLLIFQSLGAELRGPYGEIWALGHYMFSRRKNTYFIPGGGSSPLGVIGFVNAAFELKSQVEAGSMDKPDYVFVTCGSLGTIAGLLLGFKLAKLKTTIIGVRVVPQIFALYNWTLSFANAARKLAQKTLKFMRKHDESIPRVQFPEKPIILDDFYGGKYGKVTPAGVDALELMRKYENITLDTTYTAKCFAGLIDFVKQKRITDKPILFWNTYNSRELSHLKSPNITYKDLPNSFHTIFEKSSVNAPSQK